VKTTSGDGLISAVDVTPLECTEISMTDQAVKVTTCNKIELRFSTVEEPVGLYSVRVRNLPQDECCGCEERIAGSIDLVPRAEVDNIFPSAVCEGAAEHMIIVDGQYFLTSDGLPPVVELRYEADPWGDALLWSYPGEDRPWLVDITGSGGSGNSGDVSGDAILDANVNVPDGWGGKVITAVDVTAMDCTTIQQNPENTAAFTVDQNDPTTVITSCKKLGLIFSTIDEPIGLYSVRVRCTFCGRTFRVRTFHSRMPFVSMNAFLKRTGV
jgi:hypothetical protein